MPQTRWTLDVIKTGIERFIDETNRLPTAQDFDTVSYLPTARQVQRSFGGMAKLRAALGYGDVNYTKGSERSVIASRAGVRGVEAEEALELLLIDKFGEPYVHTQKRYIRGGKSRYDFYIYAKHYSFGIDIFTTDRHEYIDTNVRHKIKKYADTSSNIPIYFVLAGEEFEDSDILPTQQGMLQKYANIHLMTLSEFLKHIESFEALELPAGYKSIVFEQN